MIKPTDTFRAQHDDILVVVGQLKKRLDAQAIAKDAKEVRSLLSALASKISIHLGVEDKHLYPKLLAHADPQVSGKAKAYVAEMGNISAAFAAYTKKWTLPADIQAKPAEFVAETEAIFRALGTRIQRENDELYRLVDALG